MKDIDILNVVDTKTNTDIQLRVKTTLRFILPFRKIKVPKALSWDLTGYPRQNIVRIRTEDRRFRLLDDEQGRKMIRIALHPRDQHRALEDQLAMIRELEDQGRTILLYRDLIQKLQHTPYTSV
jgi:hypothetical protein